MLENTRKYRRSLGLVELISLGVGGTIGSGIFIVPGIAARIAGPSSLLAWFIAAISAGSVLLSLAWVSRLYPGTGAFYYIFIRVFGARISTLLVVLYLISSVFGIATIAAGIGQYVSFFGVGNAISVELAMIVIFGVTNLIGVRLSGKVENILTGLKTIPLIAISLLLLPHLTSENFVPFFPHDKLGFLGAVLIVYWPFTGFEISAIPADETRDSRDIFRSLILVLFIVTAVYLLLNIALIGSVGSEVLADSPAPIATAAGLILSRSETLVALIGIVAMMSALNAYLLGASRVLHSISHEYFLPLLSDLSPRGIPYAAIIVSAAGSAGLLFLTNSFHGLAEASVTAVLLPYIFICIASALLLGGIKMRFVAGIGIISTSAILVTTLL